MTNTSIAHKEQDQIKELSDSVIRIFEGLGFFFPEKAEETATKHLSKKG